MGRCRFKIVAVAPIRRIANFKTDAARRDGDGGLFLI